MLLWALRLAICGPPLKGLLATCTRFLRFGTWRRSHCEAQCNRQSQNGKHSSTRDHFRSDFADHVWLHIDKRSWKPTRKIGGEKLDLINFLGSVSSITDAARSQARAISKNVARSVSCQLDAFEGHLPCVFVISHRTALGSWLSHL